MNVLSRGIRNAFRNGIRSLSIVAILGLSIGLALAMLVARSSVQTKIQSVKESIGNTITVTPAGVQGFQGGGEPLTVAQLSKVAALPHVTSMVQTLSDRLTSDNTNLVSAIEAGSLGRRGADNSGVGFVAPPQGFASGRQGMGTQEITRTFTPPVTVTGTNNVAATGAFSGSTPKFVSGKVFDAAKDEDVAIVGKTLAEKNNLAVGSTFQAYGKTITVVGIYDTGNAFANGELVMQLAALQRLSGQSGSVTDATITVDSIDNMNGAVSAVKTTLGTSADVVSNQESANQAIEPLQSVVKIATFSLIGAVAAGAAIILMAMVMVVRERRREIGVFKAIGASNLSVVLQFVGEAVTLTVAGMVVGLAIGIAAASPVTAALVDSSSSSAQTAQFSQREAGPRTMRFAIRSFGNEAAANIRDVRASVGTGILVDGLIVAFVIAILGSAIPAFLIAKVRPAEIMRAE